MSKEFFFHLEQLGFASIDNTESGSKANSTAALTSVNYFLTTNNSLHLACMTRQASGNFFFFLDNLTLCWNVCSLLVPVFQKDDIFLKINFSLY